MALAKSKGNMYPWVTHVWSPIKGCQFRCSYCYARKFGYDEKVIFDEVELLTHLGRAKIIFVCHLSDMWGHWVTNQQINRILTACRIFPENQYVFQSKNPGRFREFDFQGMDVMLGTTIETDEYPPAFKNYAPGIMSRMIDLAAIKQKKFVTIEPIMDFDLDDLSAIIECINPDFVTIGADSKGHNLVEPTWTKVNQLIKRISKFTEIRQKRNLDRLKK